MRFLDRLGGALLVLCVLACWLILARAVAAEVPELARCHPEGALVESLERQFGERLMFVGRAPDFGPVLVFATPDGATWTVAVAAGTGVVCIMAAGATWAPGQMAGVPH